MTVKAFQPGEPYAYPLILKKLLTTPLTYSPEREIVYRDQTRITYRTLNERINRLANGLTRLGVKPGDVVAAFEFDSHRYLECFFAVPGMGATLQTVNWRLSPEQIVYTVNHAEAKVIIVNAFFLPLLQAVRDKLTTVKRVVLISDDARSPRPRSPSTRTTRIFWPPPTPATHSRTWTKTPVPPLFTPPEPPAAPKGSFSRTASSCCTPCPSPPPWAPTTPSAAAGRMTSTCL